MDNGKNRIVVTELPYMVNKARLIEKMAELVKDKRIDGITELRDESDRKGMRIVIELRRDANAHVILNQLYKHTQLQDTFGVIMLALVGNEPKILNLKDMLTLYLSHQEEVVTRRTKYDLNKAQERAHILEGLIIALDNIDRVIEIIRGSQTVAEAKEGLMKEFALTEPQAQAIVDMRLRVLTGLEREKLEDELKELLAKIKEYEEILGDRKVLLRLIKDEISLIAEKYGDDRRTSIGFDEFDFTDEDLIPDVPVVISRTNLGYIKRQAPDNFKAQKRGGKGIKGMQTIDEDYIEDLFMTTTHKALTFFTNMGRAYKLKGYEIPESSRTSRGTAIVNLLQLQPDEKITAIIPIDLKNLNDEDYLFMATKKGIVKKTALKSFANIRKVGLQAITLREDDELIGVKVTDGEKNIALISSKGLSICFKESDVRDMGRGAMGVKGMNLSADDEIVSMQVYPHTDENGETSDTMLYVSEKGIGKRTDINEYKLQNRGGKGLICYKVNDRSGRLIGAKMVHDNNEIMLITTEGIIIRIAVNEIPVSGRSTTGVKLINLDEGVNVATLAKMKSIEGEDDAAEETSEEASEEI